MSGIVDRKRFARRLAGWGAAAALASSLGCSAKVKQAGGLEIIIATDMPTPSSFDTVHVDVQQRTSSGGWSAPLLDKFYVIPSEIALPTTISIAAGSGPNQEVLVTITGLKGGLAGQDFVQRVVQTQVPTDRVAEVTLELASVCAGKLDCPVGDSCQPMDQGAAAAGSCGTDAIDGVVLPTFAAVDVADAGVPSAFDAGTTVAMTMGDDSGDATTQAALDATSDATPATGDDSGSTEGGGPGPGEAAAPEAGAIPEASVVPEAGSPPGGDASSDAPTCTNACSAGQMQCAAGGVQTCEVQGTGCTQWVTTSTCGPNQACNVAGSTAACMCNSSACMALGTLCQSATTLATCAKDGDGCYYVASTSPCNTPESCSGMAPSASCSLTCANSCTQGQASCVSTDWAMCTLGSNGCYAFGTPQPCGPHQSCTGAADSASCTCNGSMCTGTTNVCTSATAYATCAEDGQGCPYQSGTSSCSGTTPACLNGNCVPCAPMTTECTSDTQVETCGADGHWGLPTTCADACVGTVGVVGGNCGGVCVPASTKCAASGTAFDTCAMDGSWGGDVACTAAAPVCSGVSCICPAGSAVSNGVCCPNGQTGCGGVCVNEQTDPANCNGCGLTCPYGLCQAASCAASFFGAGHPNAGPGTPLVGLGAGTLVGDRVNSGATSHVVAIGVQTVEGGIGVRLGLYSDNAGVPGSLLVQNRVL